MLPGLLDIEPENTALIRAFSCVGKRHSLRDKCTFIAVYRDPRSQRFRRVTTLKRCISGLGNLGLTTLQRYLAGHRNIGCCRRQRWNKGIINECLKTFNRNKARIYTTKEIEFCTYPPLGSVRLLRSQTALVCRGWVSHGLTGFSDR